MNYLLNAFSLQMLQGDATVRFTEIKEPANAMRELGFINEELLSRNLEAGYYEDEEGIEYDLDGVMLHHTIPVRWKSELVSAIGHEDTARMLGVKCNRINVTLKKGDIAFVAQLQGGRLPEGSTTLPHGFEFKFFKVEIF